MKAVSVKNYVQQGHPKVKGDAYHLEIPCEADPSFISTAVTKASAKKLLRGEIIYFHSQLEVTAHYCGDVVAAGEEQREMIPCSCIVHSLCLGNGTVHSGLGLSVSVNNQNNSP